MNKIKYFIESVWDRQSQKEVEDQLIEVDKEYEELMFTLQFLQEHGYLWGLPDRQFRFLINFLELDKKQQEADKKLKEEPHGISNK